MLCEGFSKEKNLLFKRPFGGRECHSRNRSRAEPWGQYMQKRVKKGLGLSFFFFFLKYIWGFDKFSVSWRVSTCFFAILKF